MFALKIENECLRNENKNQQVIIENSYKSTGTWKTVEKKTISLKSKSNSTNDETIALKNHFNAFTTSNNEFIEGEEINDNVTIDSNPQKSQPEVKKNIAIPENYIRSHSIKTVPGDRKYAGMTKYEKKICVFGDSHIKRVRRNSLLKIFQWSKGSTSRSLY